MTMASRPVSFHREKTLNSSRVNAVEKFQVTRLPGLIGKRVDAVTDPSFMNAQVSVMSLASFVMDAQSPIMLPADGVQVAGS